jgi:hypothetical protein
MSIRDQRVSKQLLVSAILVLGLSGCSALLAQSSCLQPGAAAKHIDIVLDDNDKPEFDNGIKCASDSGSPPKGNICSEMNEKPDIRFFLKEGAEDVWEFVGMQLGQDGTNWPGNLPLGAYSDFDFDSDVALLTGWPHVTKAGNNMHVQNNNCHEFTVHYRVILRNKENPLDIFRLHPVVDNRGHN